MKGWARGIRAYLMEGRGLSEIGLLFLIPTAMFSLMVYNLDAAAFSIGGAFVFSGLGLNLRGSHSAAEGGEQPARKEEERGDHDLGGNNAGKGPDRDGDQRQHEHHEAGGDQAPSQDRPARLPLHGEAA